ncbi:MAG: hypothetical protein ACK5HP_03875 [Bacilli bacterium]
MDLKKINKKLYLYTGIGIGIVILLFLILFIVKLVIGNKVDFSGYELKMKNAAINYYKDNSESLPTNDGGKITVNISELVEKELLDLPSEILKDETAICTGEVIISNNNGYYLYTPNLDCSETYKTTFLYNQILQTEEIVSSSDGLYNMFNAYIYRGEKVNNYVKFANKTWRILRINGDNTIRLIEVDKRDTITWDDRYNSDSKTSDGINDFTISRIKDSLDEIYNNNNEFSDIDRSKIVSQNLCIGARNTEETSIDGSVECSKTMNNEPLGLLQVNEYLLGSIDSKCTNTSSSECINYNYLALFERSFWTQTADTYRSFRVYKITDSTIVTKASGESSIKLVINLSSNTIYSSGDGTLNKPYTIKND